MHHDHDLGGRRRRPLIGMLVAATLASGCVTSPPLSAPPAAPPTSAAGGGSTTIVAIAPPAPPTTNLLDFLGVTAVCQGVCKGAMCVTGLIPRLFPGFGSGLTELANQPPVRAVNDPENLKSNNPAVKAAAAAAAEEDLAPQKIQALKYMAKLGCAGCYPGVEDALLNGLDDCTESVRFAAAMAVYEAAERPCRSCRSGNCCTPKLREKLTKMGYLPNEKTGCPWEPSPRVRRAARQALLACGPGDCEPYESPAELQKPAEGPDSPEPAGPTADKGQAAKAILQTAVQD
ncbi:MAG: hypothetical protein NT069_30500 [Planctomycetota bacterium]|nr:hypothetical protein [Planctomycetota bacterium]